MAMDPRAANHAAALAQARPMMEARAQMQIAHDIRIRAEEAARTKGTPNPTSYISTQLSSSSSNEAHGASPATTKKLAQIVGEMLSDMAKRRGISDPSDADQFARLVELLGGLLYEGNSIVNDTATEQFGGDIDIRLGQCRDAWRNAARSVSAARSRGMNDNDLRFRATWLAGDVLVGGDRTGSILTP
jgi:hypothetical protein